MSMFPTSVRSRLAFGFGLLSAINLILGAADYHTLAGLNRASSELEFANRERNLTGQLFQAAAKEGLSVRGFLLTGDPKMLEAYENGKQEYGSTLAQLLEIAKTDRVRYLLGEVRRLHENYREFSDREIRLSRGMQSQRASEMMHTQAMPAFQALEMSIRAVLSDLDQQRSNLTEQQDREVKVGELITIMLCIPGTLLGLVMGSAIGRSVATSVNKMIALIQELAANNLAAEDLRMSGKDEVGQAGIALDHMKNSLAEMIRSIAGTAEHVASASEEISSAASQQVSSVGHQKDQTAQVASALQQMSATVQQVSENSGRAADASHKAADTARQGGLIVEQTLLKMQLIAESVEGTAHKVEELGKRSVQIGRIVGVINDIADQTNLLALNAAIEAARAGEQGRGFAVVADEVRKLAERTTTATKEIAAMIESVQNETQLAVQAMQDGTQQVEEGVSTTQKAGEALKEIIQMSQTVGDMVTHIATAATQQSRATDDITNSMNQIAQLLLESADGAKQSEKACQDLSRLALDLRRLVENFRLPAETVSDSTSGFGRQAASYQRQYPSQLEIHGSGKSFAAGAR